MIFLFFDLTRLSVPGPYGDEVLQAAPAVRVAQGQIPTASLADGITPDGQLILFERVWPFFQLSYLGPVKTYVLALAFAAFGATVEVMRATTAIIGFAGLCFLWLYARTAINRLASEIAVLLTGFDPTYVIFSRHDWGPFVIAFLARMAGLYCLARWWRSPDSRFAPFAAGLAFGLGLSHKADFAWFLIAGLPVAIVLTRGYRRAVSSGAVLLLLGFAVGALPLLLYNLNTGWLTWMASGASFGQSLATPANENFPLGAMIGLLQRNAGGRWAVLLLTFEGRAVSDFIVAPASPATWIRLASNKLWAEGVLLVLALLGIVLTFTQTRDWRIIRISGAFSLIPLVIFVEILATPAASGPHHSIAVYPFPQLLVAYGLSLIAQLGLKRPGMIRLHLNAPLRVLTRLLDRYRADRVLAILAFAVLSLVLADGVQQMLGFRQQLVATGGQRFWSNAIDQSAAYLAENQSGKVLQTLDWGIRDQLVMLLGSHTHVEFWSVGQNSRLEMQQQLMTGHHIFVLHGESSTLFRDIRSRFLQAVADPQWGPVVVHSFPGLGTAPVVEVYQIPTRTGRPLLGLLGKASVTPPAGDVPAIATRQVTVDGVDAQALLEHPTSQVSFDADVHGTSRLVFASGIDPSCWELSAGAAFTVLVSDEPRTETVVFHRVMRPASSLVDRHWQEAWVDLSPWNGKRITLKFLTEPVNGNYTCAWAEWRDPVIYDYGS